MFGTVEDYGDMFQDSIVETRGASLSSTNPVVYKLVRVDLDGRLVPATDEEILEVTDLLENNENDMPIIPDPGSEGYILDEGSPSQFLQLESLEGLFQSESAEAYVEKLNSRLEIKEELMHESQMLSTLPETNYYQGSIELSGDEEQVQSEVFLQERRCLLLNGCSMDQSMEVSPYSDATCSPKAPALSTAALIPEFSTVKGEIRLNNRSIKELQETFRATLGRETTVKDKQWLKRKISMGLVNSCVTSPTVNGNKLIGGGRDNYDEFIKDMVDEGRATNCKDTPSSPGCMKDHSNDFVELYSGNEDFEGEHRSAKRVRKPTKRFIEEIFETNEKQQSDEAMIPVKDQRSICAVSSGGRVVVTRMVSLGGSRIQVPYVSHARRSRPRENIMALGEFRSYPWEMKATPEERNHDLSSSQLNNDVSRVSFVKSASGHVQKELAVDHPSNKDRLKYNEVDQDIMEPDHIDTSGDSSDDGSNNSVDLPNMHIAIRRKHHRAWTLSEVMKLVEGVSKYGVGKWSEIKRLSSSSFSHRTPVDLKDKWRNLLKATKSQTPIRGSLKKHGSMVMPSEVLLQVRELAQKKSLVSPASKARLVKESRNGFL
ncbi:unnamed protein product [Cochlearia groenlandica]